MLGLDFPGDDTHFSAFLDLPSYGANPRQREVLLRNDYERGARFDPGVIQAAVNLYRFRASIVLRVTETERPRPAAVSSRGAEEASYQTDASGERYFPPLLNWTHYYMYNRHNGGTSGTWQYVTIDMKEGRWSCPLSTADPQNDAGCRNRYDAMGNRIGGRRGDQLYRLVHELGHNVGLGHGGALGSNRRVDRSDGAFYYDVQWDNVNYKPSYMSVMNYGYNVTDVCWNPAASWFTGNVGYNYWLLPGLARLDENALDESPTSPFVTAMLASAACPPGTRPAFQYACTDPDEARNPDGSMARYAVLSDGTQMVARVRAGGMWQTTGLPTQPPGVDWNCDGVISTTPVSGSVNGEGSNFMLPAEACNGRDDNGANGVDEGCRWTNEVLAVSGDCQVIPAGKGCHVPYNGGDGVYPQPLSYRQGTHGFDCQTGARYAHPAPTEEEDDPDRMEVPPLSRLPNLEICDGLDNDRDGAIDEGCPDADKDSVADAIDNCRLTYNPDQTDADGDHVGDACGDPRLSEPTAACDPDQRAVALRWASSTRDLLGYEVYRQCAGESDLAHRGGDLPSAVEAAFVDAIEDGVAGPCQYQVRPVTLAGVPLDGLRVSVEPEALPPKCKVKLATLRNEIDGVK